MLKISRMKSLFLHNNNAATASGPFQASYFHTQHPNLLCRRTTTLKPFKTPNSFQPSLSLATNCSKTSNRTSGEIHVIVGPMFAGKTTTLLKRMNLASTSGRSVVVIKSDKDTRYGLECIVTHNGEKLPCVPLADLSSFREKLGSEAYDKVDVIGIDEAQFFGDLYDFCSKAADHDGKNIIVAGLDGDYLRRTFGSVLDIIPIADSVTKLSARCEVCGEPGVFTLRKTSETKTELIAGADVYMPVCRRHYMSGQMVKDATKAVLQSQNAQFTSVTSSSII